MFRLLLIAIMVCVLGIVLRTGPDVTLAARGNPEVGKVIYETHCLRCHGKDGRGNGPEARALEPKPRNFTNPRFWEQKGEEEIFSVISKGGPAVLKRHSAMPSFEGTLSNEEIQDVMAYERGFQSP